MDTKTIVGLVVVLIGVFVGWLMIKDFNRDKSKQNLKVMNERDKKNPQKSVKQGFAENHEDDGGAGHGN